MTRERKRENWGGKRQGAGRPYRQHLTLDKETAQTLRVLLLHKRQLLNQPCLTEEQIIKSLIDNAWYELDEEVQHLAQEEI